jgi:hypothetical protein
MIRFDEISIKAWNETLQKYAMALLTGYLAWIPCRICDEMDEIRTKNEDDNSIPCKWICPLSPSSWCRNAKSTSRLHYEYHMGKRDRYWSDDLEEYLWWITIEVEMMEEEYASKTYNTMQ